MEEQPIENTLTAQEFTDTQTCPICATQFDTRPKFCNHCGYPINGSFEEQDQFDYEYKVKRAELEGANETAQKGTKALFIMAALIVVGNGIIGAVKEDMSIAIGGVFIAAIFVALAFWSKKKPFTALVTALVVYVTIILIDAAANPLSIFSGIIVKVIIISYLASGIKSAKQAQHIQEELNAKNWNQ